MINTKPISKMPKTLDESMITAFINIVAIAICIEYIGFILSPIVLIHQNLFQMLQSS